MGVPRTSERVYRRECGPGDVISLYYEQTPPGMCDEDFRNAVFASDWEALTEEMTAVRELVAVRAAVVVDDWEIGRELQNVNGAWTPTHVVWRAWQSKRSPDAAEWSNDASRPPRPRRAQIRRGTIEPYQEQIGEMLRDLFAPRSQHRYLELWAAQMEGWGLGEPRSSRGRRRGFDSAILEKQDGEASNEKAADRAGVAWETAKTRRARDRRRNVNPER